MYFFLSYAHADDEDNDLVLRLFKDIRRDMQVYAGRKDQAQHGFLDTNNLRTGDQWSFELIEALARCQVFVALCCPAYFESVPCGREWQVFSHRLAMYEAQTGRPASALIPLMWVPMDMPDIAARYQYRDLDLGQAYGDVGVRDLARMTRHRDDYQAFVGALTRRILAVRRNHAIPEYPEPRNFATIESAFHPHPEHSGREADGRPGSAETAGDPPPIPVVPITQRSGSASPERPILSTYRSQPGDPAGAPRQPDRSGNQDGSHEPATGTVG